MVDLCALHGTMSKDSQPQTCRLGIYSLKLNAKIVVDKVTSVLYKGMAFFPPHFPTYSNKYPYLVSIISKIKNLHVLVLYDTLFLSICCITCMFTHRSAPEISVEICNS